MTAPSSRETLRPVDLRPAQAPVVAPETTAAAQQPRGRGVARKLVLTGAIVLAALALAWWGHGYWTVGRFVESTDNAYVRAPIVAVATEVEGRITTLAVVENQAVVAGDLLLRLDDASLRAALAEAEAGVAAGKAALANFDAQAAQQQSTIAVAQAGLSAAQAELDYALAQAERYDRLSDAGAGSVQNAQSARAARDGAMAERERATAELARARSQIDVIATERAQAEASLSQSQAARDLAAIDLGHAELRAPRSGVIGHLGIEAGEHVRAGQTLMSLVPLSEVYVEANFKETQTDALRPGQAVEIEVDALGGRTLAGHLASLAPATGAEFSVLPADNATGNFTKIVQRIPVRVALDAPLDPASALRPGSSVVVHVNTKAD